MQLTLSALASALKAKSPIVAIPVEGHAPVCINRTLLSRALKGVRIAESHILVDDKGMRKLKTTGHAPSVNGDSIVKTSCTINAIDRRTAQKTLGVWAEKERAKAAKKLAQGALSPEQVKAAKREAIERENLSQENLPVTQARATIATIKAGIAPVIPPLTSRADTERHFATHRASRKTRTLEGALRHQLRSIQVSIRQMTDRTVAKPSITRRKHTRVTLETGPNRFLRAADAAKLIDLVKRAIALEKRIEDIQLPSAWWMRPRIVRGYDCYPLCTPAPQSTEWYDDRLQTARQLAAARAIVRGSVTVMPSCAAQDDDIVLPRAA